MPATLGVNTMPTKKSSHPTKTNDEQKRSPDVDPAYRVTRPQLAAASLISVVALATGLVWAASRANLSIGARDVDGAVARDDHDPGYPG